jgi:hypothetical protein
MQYFVPKMLQGLQMWKKISIYIFISGRYSTDTTGGSRGWWKRQEKIEDIQICRK